MTEKDTHVIRRFCCCRCRVEFRLVVFRPFQDETLVGKVLDMDE